MSDSERTQVVIELSGPMAAWLSMAMWAALASQAGHSTAAVDREEATALAMFLSDASEPSGERYGQMLQLKAS